MSHAAPPQHGSLQLLTGIFQQYRKAVARIVARIVKPHDIEDIVQETYVHIYRASQKITIHHPRSFMLKTARNLALNHVARADALNHLAELSPERDANGDFSDLEIDAEIFSESPEATVQAEEELVLFCRAVRQLPLQCRRVFILKKVYGLSQREIAKRLNIGEGTVEQHLVRGTHACVAYMEARGYVRAECARGGRGRKRAADRLRKSHE